MECKDVMVSPLLSVTNGLIDTIVECKDANLCSACRLPLRLIDTIVECKDLALAVPVPQHPAINRYHSGM